MKVLIKEYASLEAFREDYDQHLKNGGLMLTTGETLALREKVEVCFQVQKNKSPTMPAEAVYIPPSSVEMSIGFAMQGDWKNILSQFSDSLKNLEEEGEGSEGSEIWGKDSESLYHQLQKMPMSEKIQLAVRAGKQERQILMKDMHHQVHIYLLKNPKLTTDEVSRMSKSLNINTEMLIEISNNLDWMKQSSIRLSVIKNPKTPMTVVKKHMPHVSDNDLLMLAKSDGVRDAVSRLAKTMLASKGKRID